MRVAHLRRKNVPSLQSRPSPRVTTSLTSDIKGLRPACLYSSGIIKLAPSVWQLRLNIIFVRCPHVATFLLLMYTAVLPKIHISLTIHHCEYLDSFWFVTSTRSLAMNIPECDFGQMHKQTY